MGTHWRVRPDKENYLARAAGRGTAGRSDLAILGFLDMIPAGRALSYLVYLALDANEYRFSLADWVGSAQNLTRFSMMLVS